jgi:hypothetical protein
MSSIVEIASKVSTPLALSGLIAAFLFYIFRQILTKNIFPKLSAALSGTIITSIIQNLFILALVAMFLGFAGYVISLLVNKDKPPDSITISIPSGMSFRNVAKMISGNDNHTAVFRDCPDAFLETKIESGTMTGRSSKELIEALLYHLVNPSSQRGYRVEHLKDRGIYEVRCDT